MARGFRTSRVVCSRSRLLLSLNRDFLQLCPARVHHDFHCQAGKLTSSLNGEARGYVSEGLFFGEALKRPRCSKNLAPLLLHYLLLRFRFKPLCVVLFLPPDTSAEISFIREHMISWPLTCSEFYNLGLLIFRVYLSYPAHDLISLVRRRPPFRSLCIRQRAWHAEKGRRSARKKGGVLRSAGTVRGGVRVLASGCRPGGGCRVAAGSRRSLGVGAVCMWGAGVRVQRCATGS